MTQNLLLNRIIEEALPEGVTPIGEVIDIYGAKIFLEQWEPGLWRGEVEKLNNENEILRQKSWQPKGLEGKCEEVFAAIIQEIHSGALPIFTIKNGLRTSLKPVIMQLYNYSYTGHDIDGSHIFVSSDRLKEQTGVNTVRKKERRTRVNEIHICIGTVIASLKNTTNPKPSANSVWSELKKQWHKGEFSDLITKIEYYEQKKDDAIFWTSSGGTDQTMLISTFKNIVSDFHTKKKTLPAAT